MSHFSLAAYEGVMYGDPATGKVASKLESWPAIQCVHLLRNAGVLAPGAHAHVHAHPVARWLRACPPWRALAQRPARPPC